MADQPQSYANHVRYDPGFHFTLFPVAVITEIILTRMAWKSPTPSALAWWWVVVGAMACWGILKMRLYSLTVQDRVIRLEEQLRMMKVLPESHRSLVPQLTRRQLVALRFASDAELADLVQRCVNDKLEPKQIKQSIKEWRGDYFRV